MDNPDRIIKTIKLTDFKHLIKHLFMAQKIFFIFRNSPTSPMINYVLPNMKCSSREDLTVV